MGSQQELEERLALAGSEDSLHGFFLNGALDVVRELGDAVALSHCIHAAGGDSFRSFFSYPVTSFDRLLYAAAWALSERHGGFGPAMWHLGHEVVPGYLESAAGRVLLKLAGRGPKSLLHSLPVVYRTSVQHGVCSLRWTGASGAIVSFERTTIPTEYLEGALCGVFEGLRMTNPKVVGRRLGLNHTELEVSW